MYNQNWHVVYGPARTQGNYGGDTQVTDAWEVVFRMDDKPYSSPGPEIVVYCYGEYADPNKPAEHNEIVVTAMIMYDIRTGDNDVSDSDMEYDTQDAISYPTSEDADKAAKWKALRYASLGDSGWDWDGKSAMHRTGGAI